jgi:glycosyltransferase involved in cell wall biosynthesis
MASDALITIGVTCYNARETILRALESAAAQDWPAIEIVVVDDCSTDGSVEIIRNFIASDARARLVQHRENLGFSMALNTILAHASGEFVAFFDDDDESLPNRIREQVRVLSQYEAITGSRLVACYARGERCYPNGYRVDSPPIGMRGPVPKGPSVAEYLLVFKRQPGWFYGAGTPSCALLARRSTFEKIGGFDPNLRRSQDVDFAVRLALGGGHFVGTTERLYIRHMTEGAEKSAEGILTAWSAMAEKHRTFLQGICRYEYALRWYRLRHWHFKRRYARFAVEFLGLLLHNPVEATRHILATGPARLVHEHKMRKRFFTR